MEPQAEPSENHKVLLFCRWDLNSRGYTNKVTFNWRDHPIHVNILSICNPPGRNKTVHFTFHTPGKLTKYMFGYNCYGGGHTGELPRFRSGGFELNFTAGPFTLEIYEVKITDPEVAGKAQAAPARSPEPLKQLDYVAWLQAWLLAYRKKEVWFSVSKDGRVIKKHETPFQDAALGYWIRRTVDKPYSHDLLLYEYALFTPRLRPMEAAAGGFSCRSIRDVFLSQGFGVYAYISFMIRDAAGHNRHFNWGAWALEDIGRMLDFLKSLEGYATWNEFDAAHPDTE